MPTIKDNKLHQLLAKLIFIGLPTIIVWYYLLHYWNADFEIPTYTIIKQVSYFAIGLIGSMLFYALGFRFVPTFLLLICALYFLYKGIDASSIGEFDTFFIAIEFLVFGVLLSLGWFVGWGILRIKKFPIILASILLITYIFQLGDESYWLGINNKEQMAIMLWTKLGPVLAYVIFTIFISSYINHTTTTNKRFWFSLVQRTFFFFIVVASVYVLAASAKVLFFEPQLKKFTQDKGGNGNNSMLTKQPNDPNDPSAGSSYKTNDQLSMSSNNQKENILLFAAYIDNYFEDKTTPNPLYLVSFYYTKYDTLTESFERDTLLPFNDYFSPAVSSIPMYHSYSDSSVLELGKNDLYKKTISFDIYNKNLDPNFFVGPSTSFFVQPFAVEPMFRKEFVNAYRGKSSISELNSAYFIYNVEDPNIIAFQKLRYQQLSKHNDYTSMNDTFLHYYTQVPSNKLQARIDSLAKFITKDKSTVLDKVLAIKAHFQKRDSNGKKIFRYSDNPGEPNLPGASRLEHFLFKSKNGYCAYYATATLYLLRSLGIPSRVVGGFLTEDRSADKNRGWYWYYADQAHAWVQVYMPGIGWIDFDTTIDNDEARESTQTDGTPPLQPTKATFASFGYFKTIDTVSKKGEFVMTTAVVMDQNITIKPINVQLDLSLVTIIKDTATLNIAQIKPNDSATIVSYATVFNKLEQIQGDKLAQALPQPLPIDEVHIQPKILTQQNTSKDFSSNSASKYIIIVLGILFLFIATLLALPYIIFKYKSKQFNKNFDKNIVVLGYQLSRWVLKFLHQSTFNTDKELFKSADETFGTNFMSVLNAFHNYKYGKVIPNDIPTYKQNVVDNIAAINKQIATKSNIIKWMRWTQILK